MLFKWFLVLIGIFLFASRLEASEKRVGDWTVNIETDSFTDEKKHIISTSTDYGRNLVAIRCFSGQYSVAFVSMTLGIKDDDEAEIKFRADKEDIVDLSASTSDRIVFVNDEDKIILKAALKAKQLSFRVSLDGISQDFTFKTRKALDAFKTFLIDCPPDVPADGKTSD